MLLSYQPYCPLDTIKKDLRLEHGTHDYHFWGSSTINLNSVSL